MKAWLSLTLLFFCISSLAQEKKFTDIELKKILRTQKSGLIYVWSPGMPLSEKGLVEAEKLCAQNKINFVALSDPQSNLFIKDASTYDDLRKQSLAHPMASMQLQELGTLDHFPAMIFFKDGKIVKPILHGYESIEGMKIFLNTYLNSEKLK